MAWLLPSVGVFICRVASAVNPAPEESIHAPRPVLFLVGMFFVFFGFLSFNPRDPWATGFLAAGRARLGAGSCHADGRVSQPPRHAPRGPTSPYQLMASLAKRRQWQARQTAGTVGLLTEPHTEGLLDLRR